MLDTTAEQPSLHPVLSQWIDAVAQKAVDELVRLYHDHAVVRGFHEELHGSAEIEDHLIASQRQLRKMALAGIDSFHAGGDRITFHTVVRSVWGQRRVRHAWVLQGGQISEHRMELVGA